MTISDRQSLSGRLEQWFSHERTPWVIVTVTGNIFIALAIIEVSTENVTRYFASASSFGTHTLTANPPTGALAGCLFFFGSLISVLGMRAWWVAEPY